MQQGPTGEGANAVTLGPTPLVIVGAGGFGREVLELVADINALRPLFEVRGFLDDGAPDVRALQRLGLPLLGPSSRIGEVDASYVIAIGSGSSRRRIDALAHGGRQAEFGTLVHPTATLGRDVLVGDGGIVAAGSRLTTHVAIGRHAHVNVNCTIGHDVVVEDFATLFPGVHLGGGCVIGAGATLGMGSVVLPGVRVGRDAVVGAGAVVARDVADGATVVGPVARPTLAGRVAVDGPA